MEFEDEQIITIRSEKLKERFTSLDKGIYVGDELIQFTTYTLLGDKISIVLPENMFEMPIDQAKQKYLGENRPKLILTNTSGLVNFTFSLLDDQVPVGLVEGALLEFRMLIQKTQPAIEFIEDGETEARNTKIYWTCFRSPGLDSPIFNFLWVGSIDGRLLLGMFNMPIHLASAWKMIIVQLLETLTDLTIGVEEYEGTENTHPAI